jgi:hypothetical protein
MKFFVVCVIIFFTGEIALGDTPPRELLLAQIIKESGGDDFAEGDKYYKDGSLKPASLWSYGPLQIGPKCIADYNKWHRTNYHPEDCKGNRELSIQIYMSYIDHYATVKRIGRPPTLLDMAGIWNGGPNGWKLKSTLAYRQDVERILKTFRRKESR